MVGEEFEFEFAVVELELDGAEFVANTLQLLVVALFLLDGELGDPLHLEVLCVQMEFV